MALCEPVFRALNATGVRYVVGGLATVLHGSARFTADADLVVDLRRCIVGGLEDRHRGREQGRAALDSTLAAMPTQRLAWLEDAIEIAYRAGASSNRATRAPSLKSQA